MFQLAVDALAGYGLLSLAATGLLVLIFCTDWWQGRARRRVLRAAGKCRYCKFAGDLAAVALHEAQDHAERSG